MAPELDLVLAALANPVRRRIVDLLALQPATVRGTAEHVGLSLPAIDRHIDVLEAAGLLQRRKSGRTNFLAIRRSGLRALKDWIDGYDVDWGSDDESLENYITAFETTEKP